jgi:hypothetical protein
MGRHWRAGSLLQITGEDVHGDEEAFAFALILPAFVREPRHHLSGLSVLHRDHRDAVPDDLVTLLT